MNFIEASLLILFIAVLSVPIAKRFGAPLEIFLFLGSCLISFIPGTPKFHINPTIIFGLFLPPILFYAAYFTPWQDFKFNLRPIMLLSFGLVIFTTLVVASIAKLILPNFTWPEAFLLGAIVSPTDATAATSIIKKLGMPRRFTIILEGESLINDASALIFYRFSIVSILSGFFSLSQAMGQFMLSTVSGAIIGIITAYSAIYLLQKIKNVQAETTFTFITAYSTYFIAEHLGASGVIAIVVAGLIFGITFPGFATSHTKINAKATWTTLIFVINGFVFTLIGLQLATVMSHLGGFQISSILFYGMTICLVVILTRIIWIFPAAYLPRLIPSIKRKDPMPSWKYLFVLGLSGMRGIVSLAAVVALPSKIYAIISKENLILLICITYIVVFVTLLLPTMALPYFAKIFNLKDNFDTEYKVTAEAKVRTQIMHELINYLEILSINNKFPKALIDQFIDKLKLQQKVIHKQLNSEPASMLSDEFLALKRLTLVAIDAERKILLNLRHSGKILDEIFWELSEELDIEELRAKTMRI